MSTDTITGDPRPTLPPQSERNQSALTIATAALGTLEDVCLGRLPGDQRTLGLIATSLRAAGDLVQAAQSSEVRS